MPALATIPQTSATPFQMRSMWSAINIRSPGLNLELTAPEAFVSSIVVTPRAPRTRTENVTWLHE